MKKEKTFQMKNYLYNFIKLVTNKKLLNSSKFCKVMSKKTPEAKVERKKYVFRSKKKKPMRTLTKLDSF